MSTLREAAEEALRWMEHARLHLTIKERMHPDGLGLYDNAAEALRAALAQPETEAQPVVIGPEWTPCVKLPITVHVREQRPDEQHVSTREGITPVKPDDLIMRGVAGEEYPIGRELFEKTYRIGAHPPRDEWRLASEPPEDGRDVVVWCAQERRAVHGMYVRRHPPVVGLVDGWVAPDASKLTHWRDVTPPMEGE